MLYNVLLTFESLDEILERDHSNESYSVAVLYCGTVHYVDLPHVDCESRDTLKYLKWDLKKSMYYAAQGGSKF